MRTRGADTRLRWLSPPRSSQALSTAARDDTCPPISAERAPRGPDMTGSRGATTGVIRCHTKLPVKPRSLELICPPLDRMRPKPFNVGPHLPVPILGVQRNRENLIVEQMLNVAEQAEPLLGIGLRRLLVQQGAHLFMAQSREVLGRRRYTADVELVVNVVVRISGLRGEAKDNGVVVHSFGFPERLVEDIPRDRLQLNLGTDRLQRGLDGSGQLLASRIALRAQSEGNLQRLARPVSQFSEQGLGLLRVVFEEANVDVAGVRRAEEAPRGRREN